MKYTSWKRQLIKSDGSRRNLSSATGTNISLLKDLWRSTFRKDSPYRLLKPESSIHIRALVRIKYLPTGEVLKVRLNTALEGGEPVLDMRRKGGISSSLTTSEYHSKFRAKFGKDLSILDCRRDRGDWQLLVQRHSTQERGWMPLKRLRDRVRLITLFDPTANASEVRAVVRKNRLDAKIGRLKEHLEDVVGEKLRIVKYDSEDIWLKYRSVVLPLRITCIRQGVSSREDFLRRYYAWVRFGWRQPLRYTDAEWSQKVLEHSKNKVEVLSKYRPQGHQGKHKLRCLSCKEVFYRDHLFNIKNQSISCPFCSHQKHRNYSKIALAWIADLEKDLGVKIRSADSSEGEAKIKVANAKLISVDGFHKRTNTVLEFYGSRWHGNPTVFYLDDHPVPYDSSVSAKSLLLKTLKREYDIESSGFNLIKIWDQDFIDKDRYKKWKALNKTRLNRMLQ